MSTEVQALQSFLVPKQPITLPRGVRDFRVVVSRWNTPLVTIRLLSPRGNRCSLVTHDGHSDISVSCGNGETLQLGRHDALLTKYCPARLLEVPNQDLPYVLEGISRFNVHLYRRNPREPFKGNFDVQLHRVQPGSDTGLRPVLHSVGEDLFSGPAEDVICAIESSCRIDRVKHAIVTDMNPYYGLTLINTSNFDLYPYVFYFDPGDCSVEVCCDP